MDMLALQELHSAQGGPFRWSQALQAGVPAWAARAAIRDGHWKKLRNGVYVERYLWESLDALGQHRCLLRATLLVKTADWRAARRSAAVGHDLPLLGKPPAHALLTRDGSSGSQGRSRFERVAALPAEDVDMVDGIAVTAMARTVVDLAREESSRNAVVVADGALRAGITKDELLRVAHRCAGWPGGLQALRIVSFADGLAESPLESMSRHNCRSAGLAIPELQISIHVDGEPIARVDHLWRDVNTIGQADGKLKYTDHPEQVYLDKLQDERLEDLGFEVARWSWDEAWRNDGRFIARIGRAMERGARQTLDPRVRFIPTTLEQSLMWTGRLAS